MANEEKSVGTPIRPIRMSNDFFNAAKQTAQLNGYGSVTDYVRALLKREAKAKGIEIPFK